MRVVVDTNVLVSALIRPQGRAAQLFVHPLPFSLVTSSTILDELTRALHYPRLFKRYNLTNELIDAYVATLRATSILITVPPELLQAIAGTSPDPDDDKFLACALASAATCLVTGDQHLRNLGEYQGIPILTPAQFLSFLDATLS